MHSPASGRITADLILQGHSDLIDASQLSVERFAEGRLLKKPRCCSNEPLMENNQTMQQQWVS